MATLAKTLRPALLLCAALLAAPAAFAQDLSLLVRHKNVATGPDGVKRTVEFAERSHRRGDTIWVERVVPPDALPSHPKEPTSHRHLDVATAARWITRGASGKPSIRLVSAHDAVVVEVAETDWGNIGFDGSWSAAWHLLDPALLARMTAEQGADGTITYSRRDAGRELTVVWSPELRIVSSVEAQDSRGSRSSEVERIASPVAMPWEQVGAFQRRDYADYLD